MREVKQIKTLVLLALAVIFAIVVLQMPVMATTKDNLILKKADESYLIYYETICKEEFEFAFSNNPEETVDNLKFKSSAKDSTGENALNIAYIDENLYEEYFSKETYIWIRNQNDEILVSAELVNLNNAIDDSIVNLVNTTTKANEATPRIEIDTTKLNVTHPEVEGVITTVTTGKIKICEKENCNYKYCLISATAENEKALELYNLAQNMSSKDKNTYEKLSNVEKFYNLYEELMPKEDDWKDVENYEILQPESARSGDKFIVYIKEENEESSIVDVKLLESKYSFEEQRIDEEDKTLTEVVKLPVTYDEGIVLIVLLAIIVIAIIVATIVNKKMKNKEK